MVKLDRVTKTIGGRRILSNVSFHLSRGDIFGYLGPNGAGKTTTVRAITGLIKPDFGSIEIMGREIGLGPEVRTHVGAVLDSPGLYEDLDAKENLLLFARIYNVPRTEWDRAIKSVLDKVELPYGNDRPIRTFSTGMKRRLAIARALLHEPQLLIFDEPTSNLDPEAQKKLRDLIVDLARDRTVLLTSHNLDEVQRICTSVAIIVNGTIKLFETMSSIRERAAEPVVELDLAECHIPDAERAIVDSGYARVCRRIPTGVEVQLEDPARGTELMRELLSRGIPISGFRRKSFSLEELYLSVTTETSTATAEAAIR